MFTFEFKLQDGTAVDAKAYMKLLKAQMKFKITSFSLEVFV
jgi:hypothetical protein